MPNSLIIFILILGVLSLFLIYQMVKRKRMLVSHSILWNILIISIMLASVSTGELKKVATFIGIAEVSNLIFFIGFLVLLVLNLLLTVNLSKQKSTTIALVQELALTNKRMEELNGTSSKKSNKKI